MPPIECAIIGGVLCWRYLGDGGKWRVSNPAAMTNEIIQLREQAGLPAYPILEDAESTL